MMTKDIDRFKRPRLDSSSVPRNAPFVVAKLPSGRESTRSRLFNPPQNMILTW